MKYPILFYTPFQIMKMIAVLPSVLGYKANVFVVTIYNCVKNNTCINYVKNNTCINYVQNYTCIHYVNNNTCILILHVQ